MKRRLGIIIAIAIFAASAGLEIKAAGKPSIFIKSLVTAKAVKKDDASRLTKLIVESLVKMQRYEVMSDDQISQLLDNTAKQQLLGCNSEECIAQIMETTQTDFILYGDIEKEGKGYIVSVSLIQRVKGGSSTLKGSSNTELTDLSFNSMKSQADFIIRDIHGEGGKITRPEKENTIVKPEKEDMIVNPEREEKAVISEKTKKGETKKFGNTEMVYIEGGTFQMGSNLKYDEKPIHSVTVDGFWIGKYEVTQKEYSEIMVTNPSSFKGDNLPVETVSWENAVEFCKKFSKKYNVKARLPYEAEWEYAARGGTSTKFFWGDMINGDYVWYKKNSGSKTNPVGQKKPNAFGLYDMSGNVWEWCADWYDQIYYKNSPSKNPVGAQKGSHRILRGGSWAIDGDDLSSSSRTLYIIGDNGSKGSGFRVVVSR